MSPLIQFRNFFQPAGDSVNSTGLLGHGRHPALSPGANNHHIQIGCGSNKDKIQHSHQMPSNNALGAGAHGAAGNHMRGDDGSSGYGSPDSETFEVPANQ